LASAWDCREIAAKEAIATSIVHSHEGHFLAPSFNLVLVVPYVMLFILFSAGSYTQLFG
jgi:hypothetical protein